MKILILVDFAYFPLSVGANPAENPKLGVVNRGRGGGESKSRCRLPHSGTFGFYLSNDLQYLQYTALHSIYFQLGKSGDRRK